MRKLADITQFEYFSVLQRVSDTPPFGAVKIKWKVNMTDDCELDAR